METKPWMIIAGAFFTLLSVMLGAFAAHGLKHSLDSYSMGVFQTAVEYQMHHGIGILVVAVLYGFKSFSSRWLSYAAIAFITGCLLFSGSLYLLALSGVKWLGAIAPIGGVAFLLGWLLIIMSAIKSAVNSNG